MKSSSRYLKLNLSFVMVCIQWITTQPFFQPSSMTMWSACKHFPSFSKRVSLSFPSFFTLRGWARAGHLSSFAFQSSYYFFHYHFVSQKGSKKPSMRTTVAMRILLLLLGLRVLSLSFLGLRMVVAQKAAPHPETASWNRENGRWRNAMAT
jgi:hypothetical protein